MSDHTPTPPADRPAAWPKAAGAVVAAIIVAAIIITWQIATRSAQPTPEPPATTEGQAPAAGCPEGPVQMSGTLTAAPETTWVLVARMATPTVDQAGPGLVDPDGYRHCYTRTPTGALVAAANLVAMGSVPELADRLATDGMMPGPLRDRVLASPEPGSSAPTSSQLRGFRMVSYDGETAVVDLGLQAANGGYGSLMITLVWHDGDWRYGVRGEGAGQELDVTISWPPTLTGYIHWAGV